MPALERFWDEAYARGEHRRHWELPHPSPRLVAWLAAHPLPPGPAALDVGCGGGRDALFLARQGLRVTGLDLSREALRIAECRARRAGLPVDWLHGDVLDAGLALPSGHFTLAADRGCFHLVGAERRRTYAATLHRLLAPGGVLLLSGAADDDEEEGLVGIDRRRLAAVFAASRFEIGPIEPCEMPSEAGTLAGVWVEVKKKG